MLVPAPKQEPQETSRALSKGLGFRALGVLGLGFRGLGFGGLGV